MRRPVAASPPDLEALLCALVLAPATYARNRFYWLYADPAAKRVRMRAAQLRGIVRQLAGRDGTRASVLEARAADEGDRRLLRYQVPSMGLERTALLERLEDAVVRYALERAGASALLPLDAADRTLVEAALARLASRFPSASATELDLDAPPEERAATGSFGSEPSDD